MVASKPRAGEFRYRPRRVLWTMLFMLFLMPVQYGAFSVNYLFVLFPAVVILLRWKILPPPPTMLIIIAVFTVVLFVAGLYQFWWIQLLQRRLISFALFMTVFAFACVRIDERMVVAFKGALVGLCVVLATYAMYALSTLSRILGTDFELAKTLVGSQRVGFLFVLAFWVVYFQTAKRFWGRALRLGLLLVLVLGTFLTFSRSSVFSLAVSVAFYIVVSHGTWITRPQLRSALTAVTTVAGAVLVIMAVQRVVPLAFSLFSERLFSVLIDFDLVANILRDPGTSEGTRIAVMQQVLTFVSTHPLTGSGYLGFWVLPGAEENSAHNQYADVLFRTGIFGFAAYVSLLWMIGRFLWREDRALFWGYLGVLVYGFFHETFKESQGAFVLAFLVGMAAQRPRRAPSAARGERPNPDFAPSLVTAQRATA